MFTCECEDWFRETNDGVEDEVYGNYLKGVVKLNEFRCKVCDWIDWYDN